MGILTRDQIFAVNDIETEEVNVPEWGGSVIVKGMTGEEKNEFENSLVSVRGKNTQLNVKNATAKLVALTVVDDQGNKMFSQADVEALGRKSGKALYRVYDVASRLSGITSADFDELTKN